MSKSRVWRVEPNTPCKIGIIGPKEVGKTTLANLLNGHLKSLGASSDLVHESARNCPFPLSERTSIASAYWLLGAQIAAEALVQATRQFTVCDRTVIDEFPFVVYAAKSQTSILANETTSAELALKTLIRDYLIARPYDFLFYVPIRPELWKTFSMPSDPSLQAAVDKEFRTFLQELRVHYHELKELGNQERLNEVMEHLRRTYRFPLEESRAKQMETG